MYLDLESLLNVGQSCKLFQKSAVYIYKRKFGTLTVALKSFDYEYGHCDSTEIVSVSGCEVIFPFLHIFGPEVSHLHV